MNRTARLLAFFLLPALPGAAAAATITVNDPSDELHGSACAATGTGACTLRDAITFANARRGKDTVVFALGSGPARIALSSPLPPITDPILLDGTSQPGFEAAPLIQIDGSGAGEDAVALRITAGASTVRGFVVSRFAPGALGAIVLEEKGGNVLERNFVGVDATGAAAAGNRGHGILVSTDGNTIGGAEAGAGNLVSGNAGDGIRITGSRNLVMANRIGTDAAGVRAIPNRGDGIASGGGNTIGSSVSGAGNLVSGNGGVGISAGPNDAILGNFVGTDESGRSALGNGRGGIRGGGKIGGSDRTSPTGACSGDCNLVSGNAGPGILPGDAALVQGNFVGTDAAGTAALANRAAGISIQKSVRVTVGGNSPAVRNLVSGNAGAGIELAFEAEGARILGNAIGVDAVGVERLGNAIGVLVRDGARRNQIGGDSATEGNRIAFNSGAGVEVQFSAGPGNTIRGNAIYENGGLGIDLGGDGVTEDPPGSAAGLGTFAAFPVLTRATPYSVEGTLDAAPSADYTIELFASPRCDPSGYGEGEAMIALTTFSTDPAGHAEFGVSLTAPPGQQITATTTDAAGNTSEFSSCIEVEEPAEPAPD
jgi:hypothetical protein